MELEILTKILDRLEAIERKLDLNDKPFLSVDEASQYLGVSRCTVYQYVSKKILPYHKLQGRRLYFSRDDLINFILNPENRRSSKRELEEKANSEVLINGFRRNN